MHTVDELLRIMIEREASDLHIKSNSPVLLRIHGELYRLDDHALPAEEAKRLAYSILTEQHRAELETAWELDFGYEIEGLSRFRVNAFWQRETIGMIFRAIPFHIRTIEDLGLPEVCRYFSERPRGLVLVTGPAGSGKSTTQAAMLDYVNERFACHIVTVEDPIEFVHQDKKAIINQRELGADTHSFANALKYVLRQDPDVILIGEMRDLETIHLAITAAETGHLVLGTLHTTDAVQTVDRVIDVFPTHQQQQIRMQLAVNLLGVISQILVKRADEQGRVPAFETMVAIPAVRNSIRENKTYQISSIIQTGQRQGMISLDHYLAGLVRSGQITYDDALSKSSYPQEFQRILPREEARGPARPDASPVGQFQ
jgi:twitching motility protein PilT